MKKILITGASGTIGFLVIKYLLVDENSYEITALDLKNCKTIKKFKKYRKKLNLVYGDINDKVLMDKLIKDHDTVIHLAGVLPPLADLKSELTKIVDFGGTKTIVDAINSENPKCHLIYASSCTVYGKEGIKRKVSDKLCTDSEDYYSSIKIEVEALIKDSIKNYTIFRLPALLCDPRKDAPMYNIPLDSKVELISSSDAAYAFARSINFKKELNKNTYNISGGSTCRTTFRNHLLKMLKIHGLSIRYLVTLIMVDKNFYGGYYEDGAKIDDILQFRNVTLSGYYKELKENSNRFKRFFPRLFAFPFIAIVSLKNKHRK